MVSPSAKKITQGIVKYLMATNTLHWLPEIIQQLQQKAQQLQADNKAYVSSTYKLTKKEVAQIAQALQVVFNKKLTIINVVNPSLIGGIKISVSDKVIDLSLDRTLSNLKTKISND